MTLSQRIFLTFIEKRVIENIVQYPSVKVKLFGIIRVGIDVTDQLLIIFFVFVSYWRRNGNCMSLYISY
jgi:hypothetical protein